MASYGRTLLLFGLLTGLFVAIGWVVGALWAGDPFSGMAVFLAIAAAMNIATYFFSDKFVLWSYGAKVVTEEEAPRLYRIVRRLVEQNGMPMPRVAIIPEMAPNAFATGRNPKHAVVAATEGILRALDDDELTGVMAHELAHVKNRDILIMSVAATISGAIAFAARGVFWGAMFGGGDREEGGGNLLVAIVLMITAPIAALLVQFAISRSREYAADRIGAQICGRPLALANALEKLDAYARRVPMQHGSPATAHLFIVNPFRGGAMAQLFSTHPPMGERVKRLREMAYAI